MKKTAKKLLKKLAKAKKLKPKQPEAFTSTRVTKKQIENAMKDLVGDG